MKNIPNVYVFELAINLVLVYHYFTDLTSWLESPEFRPDVINFSTTLCLLLIIKIKREGTRAPFLF